MFVRSPLVTLRRIRLGASLGGSLFLLFTLLPLSGQEPAPADKLLAQAGLPLEKLDPAAIPELERFDWQGKDVAAVAAEHLGRHASTVTGVAMHPDGKLAISGGSKGLVRLWDPATMRLQERLPTGGSITCIALSKNGKRLAAGLTNGLAVVWELDENHKATQRHVIKVSTEPVLALDFSPPEGNELAIGSQDKTIQLWDVSGAEAKPRDGMSHLGAVFAVAYSPDGKRLASGGGDKVAKLWKMDGARPKELLVLEGHTDAVRAVAFSPDDKNLASGSLDGTVKLWAPNGSSRLVKKSFPANARGVYAIAYSPDSKTLATGGIDATSEYHIHLWNPAPMTPKEEAKLDRHEGTVTSLAFSPSGDELLSGSLDWTTRLWHLKKGKPTERTVTVGHLSHVYAVAFTRDGKTLASSSVDGTVRLWDVTHAAPKERRVLRGNPTMHALAISRDDRTLFCASTTGLVKQWDIANGKDQREFKVPPAGYPQAVALSPGGEKVIYSFADKSVVLYDVAAGKEFGRLQGHEALVRTLSFSADGRRLMTGSGEALLKDGKPVLMNDKPVYVDCTVRLWDVARKQQLQVLGKQAVPVLGVGLAPDGRHGYSYDSSPYLLHHWEQGEDAAKELESLRGTIGPTLLVSPDGKRLVALWTTGISVWDVASGKNLMTWRTPEYATCATFAADSQHLAVGLWTGVVYVFRLGPTTAAT